MMVSDVKLVFVCLLCALVRSSAQNYGVSSASVSQSTPTFTSSGGGTGDVGLAPNLLHHGREQFYQNSEQTTVLQPMFRGRDGRTFFFDGTAGKVFNLISEQDHQFNAEFGLGPHKIDSLGQKSNGTYMTAFGLQMYSSKLEVHVNEEGHITVAVNDVQTDDLLMEENDYRITYQDPNHVSITVEKYRAGVGHTIVARSPLMELVMYGTPKQFDPAVNQIARGHLNFDLGLNTAILQMTDLHGILGQNSRSRAGDIALIPNELATLFLGEGEDSDYVVSGLFASDCTYNKYGVKSIIKMGSLDQLNIRQAGSLKLGSVSRRRHLIENHKITYKPFAKVAGLL